MARRGGWRLWGDVLKVGVGGVVVDGIMYRARGGGVMWGWDWDILGVEGDWGGGGVGWFVETTKRHNPRIAYGL